MKRWPMLLTLLAFTGLIAGCTLTDNEEDNLSLSEYLSFAANQTWTYSTTGTNGSGTTTRTTTGQVQKNGQTYWALTYIRSNSQDSNTVYLRISGETVYAVMDSTGIEGPFFRFGISANTSWTVKSGTTMKYVGLENVMVDAGNYEDCAKFVLTETGTGWARTEAIWLAPGVGPVKAEWTQTSGTQTYTGTEELTNYTAGNGGGGNGGGTTINAADYLPIQTGVKWVYKNDASTETRSRTVTGTKEYNGHTYYLVREISPNKIDSTGIRIDGQTMYMFQDGTEVPYFKFGITPGTTWTAGQWTARYDGLFTVGNYTNCAKFTHTSGSETEIQYVAPHVGPVKFSHTNGNDIDAYTIASFSTTAGNEENNTTLASYIQFAAGESWTYSVTATSQGGTSMTFTKSRQVTEQVMKDGKMYWVMLESGGNDGADSSGARIDGQTMYVLMRETNNDSTFSYIEVPFFKFGLAAGTTWFDGGRTAMYCGFEDVKIGSTIYANCMKFTYTYTETFIPDNSGMHTYTHTETEWLAPNVGPVKEQSTMTDGSDVTYTQTAVLTNHSMPQ